MSMKWKQDRVINIGLAVFTLILLASALNTVIENVAGGLFVIVIVAFLIREFWSDTVGEWRKDRALIREVGEWDDPHGPILLIDLDGHETLVRPGDRAYPQALVDKHTAQALARREPRGG